MSAVFTLNRVHEGPPTTASLRVKADRAGLFSVSACCGDPLWSVRWPTCIDVVQTGHSCVNTGPGQAEAWPTAITVSACAGIGMFDQRLCFLTS